MGVSTKEWHSREEIQWSSLIILPITTVHFVTSYLLIGAKCRCKYGFKPLSSMFLACCHVAPVSYQGMTLALLSGFEIET